MPKDIPSVRTAWSLEALQAEAYRLVEEFQIEAATPVATELEQIHAETAKLIVAIAEKKAGVIDGRVSDSRLAELQNCGDRLIRTLEEEVQSSPSMTQAGNEAVSVETLRSEALQIMNIQLKAVIETLNENSRKAWHEACEALSALRAGRHLHDEHGRA